MARSSETLPPSSPITASSDLPGPGSDLSHASSDDSTMTERYNRLLHSKSQKKRKHDGEDVSLTRLGRGIRKTIDLYADIDNLIILADAYEFNTENPELSDSEDEDEEDAKAKAEVKLLRKRASTALKLFVSSVPNIDKALSNVQPQVLTTNLAQLQRGANDGRSEDTSNLRGPVANWVSQLDPSAPPLLSDDKAARGLQHNKCGELLSSVEHDWNDPEVRKKIRNFEEGYESSMFARALYSGYSGDPENLEVGFLKSSMMVKAFKQIFTSPKSSQDIDVTADNVEPPSALQRLSRTRKSGKKSVAALLRMHTVTPRAIAYVAVQLLFALSSAPSWTPSHQGMDFQQIYYEIIDYFEDVDDDEASQESVKELLQWWNHRVFPNSAAAGTSKPGAAKTKLKQQRAARRRALTDVAAN